MGWSGPMTHRQYLGWKEWLTNQYNHPSRTDWYLLELMTEVRRSWVKNPKKVTTLPILKFVDPADKDKKPTMTKEQATRWSKQRWFKGVGMVPRIVYKTKEELEAESCEAGEKEAGNG